MTLHSLFYSLFFILFILLFIFSIISKIPTKLDIFPTYDIYPPFSNDPAYILRRHDFTVQSIQYTLFIHVTNPLVFSSLHLPHEPTPPWHVVPSSIPDSCFPIPAPASPQCSYAFNLWCFLPLTADDNLTWHLKTKRPVQMVTH